MSQLLEVRLTPFKACQSCLTMVQLYYSSIRRFYNACIFLYAMLDIPRYSVFITSRLLLLMIQVRAIPIWIFTVMLVIGIVCFLFQFQITLLNYAHYKWVFIKLYTIFMSVCHTRIPSIWYTQAVCRSSRFLRLNHCCIVCCLLGCCVVCCILQLKQNQSASSVVAITICSNSCSNSNLQ